MKRRLIVFPSEEKRSEIGFLDRERTEGFRDRFMLAGYVIARRYDGGFKIGREPRTGARSPTDW